MDHSESAYVLQGITTKMSSEVKRAKRVNHYKQGRDWALLFADVAAGESCVQVAQRYPGVNVRTLQDRYKRWRAARAGGDKVGQAAAEGKIDGRRYSNSSFTPEEELSLAKQLKARKKAGDHVGREEVQQATLQLWGELHPHFTRAVPRNAEFQCSPHFVTRFRRRHHLSTTQHKLRKEGPPPGQKEDEKINQTAEYLMRVDDAVEQYGPNNVINADETAAHAIQHPRTSWGITGEPNFITAEQDPRRAITTMPVVSAAGDRLPTQVIVKGKTQLAVNNKHLPHSVAAYPAPRGWQTSATLASYIEEEVAQYTDDQPSALILDDYSAHRTKHVKETAAAHNIELIQVPTGQTSTLQPLDVGINGPIKKAARKQWTRDKRDGKENADTLGRAAERVDDAVRSLPAPVITAAFSKAVPSLKLPR